MACDVLPLVMFCIHMSKLLMISIVYWCQHYVISNFLQRPFSKVVQFQSILSLNTSFTVTSVFSFHVRVLHSYNFHSYRIQFCTKMIKLVISVGLRNILIHMHGALIPVSCHFQFFAQRPIYKTFNCLTRTDQDLNLADHILELFSFF